MINKFKLFWKSYISELQNLKQDYSGIGSFRLIEMLNYDPPQKNKILEELKRRGHHPGSKWYKEFIKK